MEATKVVRWARARGRCAAGRHKPRNGAEPAVGQRTRRGRRLGGARPSRGLRPWIVSRPQRKQRVPHAPGGSVSFLRGPWRILGALGVRRWSDGPAWRVAHEAGLPRVRVRPLPDQAPFYRRRSSREDRRTRARGQGLPPPREGTPVPWPPSV